MKKHELQTPAILLDLDKMENNIKVYQEAADKNKKQLWPMTKTHKSTEIAKMQKKVGASGFLCGTLDECEAFAEAGLGPLMYAYPLASDPNLGRLVALCKKTEMIVRLDDVDAARAINDAAAKAGITVEYTVIVDCGFHRFGVEPDKIVAFAGALKGFDNLRLRGISTHPGHIYGCSKANEIPAIVKDELGEMRKAAKALRDAGFTLDMVTSGSTPTYFQAVTEEGVDIFHPGNYTFLDIIQVSIECAKESDCALTVLATIVSHPKEDLYIMDAGAKCLGLDQGAHGNTAIKGFGVVKGHPEMEVYALSEEVGKMHVRGKTDLKVGDKIEVIPNHSCSTANMTSFYVCCRGEDVVETIFADVRGNSTKKGVTK